LLFWGDQNRRLRAFDAESGKVLWESLVGGMVMNSMITYSVKGKQYVMVFTGEGQSVSAGPLRLTEKTMPKAVRGHNSVVVYALP
jgi:glucose dehydrogenase